MTSRAWTKDPETWPPESERAKFHWQIERQLRAILLASRPDSSARTRMTRPSESIRLRTCIHKGAHGADPAHRPNQITAEYRKTSNTERGVTLIAERPWRA
jgi:hypothetical protein